MYEAEVTRDGRWWMITIPSIDALTQARHVAEIPLMARELIAVHEGHKLEDVEVTVHYGDVNGVDGDQLATLEKNRRYAALFTHLAATRTRSLARELVDAKVPLREVAQLLGVSHQRVHLLVSGEHIETTDAVPDEELADVIDLVAALRRNLEAAQACGDQVERQA